MVLDGYSLRILTAQGDEAPGGSRSYIVNGKMTGGYAILATPVKYAETGIMTFMTGAMVSCMSGISVPTRRRSRHRFTNSIRPTTGRRSSKGKASRSSRR